MKHLSLDDRIQIQRFVTTNLSFVEIANRLGKNRTTISREIKTYARIEGKPSRNSRTRKLTYARWIPLKGKKAARSY